MDRELYWKQLLFFLVISGALTHVPESCLDTAPAPWNSETTPGMLWLEEFLPGVLTASSVLLGQLRVRWIKECGPWKALSLMEAVEEANATSAVTWSPKY